jgi:hypothetical protein
VTEEARSAATKPRHVPGCECECHTKGDPLADSPDSWFCVACPCEAKAVDFPAWGPDDGGFAVERST